MKNRYIFKKLMCFMLTALFICSAALISPDASASAPVWTNKFTDVPEGVWYENALAYMNYHGYINGISDNKFGPDGNTTRAMFVTILGRIEGINADKYAGNYSFSDSAPDYARGYIAWAYDNGVVKGIGDNKFGSELYVTREQVATIFYNYAKSKGENVSTAGDLSKFSDYNNISGYAYDAMVWAVGEKIINGSGDTLLPGGNAPRCQIAQIFVNVENHKGTDTAITVLQPLPEVDPADILTVGGRDYYIGMPLKNLTALAGSADEILPSINSWNWYVYGTDTYDDFFMAGISGDKVVSLCSSGTGFSYMGKVMGDTSFSFSGSDLTRVNAMTDKNDNYILHCIMLTDKNYRNKNIYSSDTLNGESKVDYHLVNAFRQYHNRSILSWSDKASASAILHSQDMAKNNFFNHTNLDGLTPGDRMSDQGIRWRTCGENIAAGYYGGVSSHDGWVNSSGHRTNILNASYAYVGVGFAYNSGSYYKIYSTENFFA